MCAQSDDRPQVDERGYAPTRIVRSRWIRHGVAGGRIHFFRVWAKPDDPKAGGEEREIVGRELAVVAQQWLADQARRVRGIRLPPRGIPQKNSRGAEEVRAIGADDHTHEGLKKDALALTRNLLDRGTPFLTP